MRKFSLSKLDKIAICLSGALFAILVFSILIKNFKNDLPKTSYLLIENPVETTKEGTTKPALKVLQAKTKVKISLPVEYFSVSNPEHKEIICFFAGQASEKDKPTKLGLSTAKVSPQKGRVLCETEITVPESGTVLLIASLREGASLDSTITAFTEFSILKS